MVLVPGCSWPVWKTCGTKASATQSLAAWARLTSIRKSLEPSRLRDPNPAFIEGCFEERAVCGSRGFAIHAANSVSQSALPAADDEGYARRRGEDVGPSSSRLLPSLPRERVGRDASASRTGWRVSRSGERSRRDPLPSPRWQDRGDALRDVRKHIIPPVLEIFDMPACGGWHQPPRLHPQL